MTIPDMPTPPPVDVDAVLAERCESAGEHLAGIIAAGMLDAVGRPSKLPELLWPHADPELVRSIWESALPVGYRAGKLAHRDWSVEGLDRLRAVLREAGFVGMARLVSRSAATVRPAAGVEHERTADGDVWAGEER